MAARLILRAAWQYLPANAVGIHFHSVPGRCGHAPIECVVVLIQNCPIRRGKVDEDRRTIAVGDDLLDAHHRAAVPLHNVHRDRRSREQLFLLRRCSKVLRQPLIQSKRRCSCRHAAQDRDDRRKHRRRVQAASSFCLVRHVHYLRKCVFGGVKRGDCLLIKFFVKHRCSPPEDRF